MILNNLSSQWVKKDPHRLMTKLPQAGLGINLLLILHLLKDEILKVRLCLRWSWTKFKMLDCVYFYPKQSPSIKQVERETQRLMTINPSSRLGILLTRNLQLFKDTNLQCHTVFNMILNTVQSLDSKGAVKIKK